MKKVVRFIRYIWVSPSNKDEKLKRYVYAILWQVYKRVGGKPIIANLDNGPSFVLDPKSGNSTGAIYTKVYEAEYVYFLRQHIQENKGKQSLIDVGAHTGLFSLLLSNKVSTIAAFEPANDTIELLKRNVALNPEVDFLVEKKGVSEKSEVLNFIVKGENSGMNSIARDAGDSTDVAYQIHCTSIDDYVAQTPQISGVSCIKIDTEGHEHNVLLGAKKTIENNSDIIILYENSSYNDIQDLLKTYGLKSFAITTEGKIIQEEAYMAAAYNLFAVGPDHPLQDVLRSDS